MDGTRIKHSSKATMKVHVAHSKRLGVKRITEVDETSDLKGQDDLWVSLPAKRIHMYHPLHVSTIVD